MPNEIKTQLRIPEDLHAVVKALAEKERRSLNAEIVVLLEEAVKARQPAVEEPATGFSMQYDTRKPKSRSR